MIFLDIMLYHAFLPENHQHHVPFKDIMEDGIKSTTQSNHVYGNGGSIHLEITERFRPVGAADWIDFKNTVRANITNRFSKSFCFPVFTNKIKVFNSEISLNIYDQAFYEDLKYTDEEALNFDTGKSLEYWIKEYWQSMVSLEQYIEKKPYKEPEILIFEDVPRQIIKVCEK